MSATKQVLRWVMGAFYVVAGVMHFATPDAYLPMMPPYLPAHAAFVFWSGVGEVLCGVGVLVSGTRVAAAWGTIALLVAIFPANVHIALHNVPLFGASEGAGIWNWVRLPFQGVLIAWAHWYTRVDRPGLL